MPPHCATSSFADALRFCPGSGGWGKPGDADAAKQGLPAVQLHDLSTDPAETTNLHEKHPEVVQRLTKLLNDIIANGRSTPGAPQKNDVPVIVAKPNGKAAKE